MNKKGQELSTNAIIMIVIGIIVLVVLILGFTIGWGKLFPFISSNNVENIKTTCSTACATNNMYDYCSLERTLKADDLPGKKTAGNCTWFATNADYTKYGIETCPGLCD
ncbi:MAG: hypothetical protein NTW17_01635 [Candidatus Pacearchaeota archaeon]|nr:hypothetical protein [Candidatus Pacearchaeota archaeon]